MLNNPTTHEVYIHNQFTEETLGFIREDRNHPFFLYLPYTIPHAEVLVPEGSQRPHIDVLGGPERPPIEAPYAMRGYNTPRHPRAAPAGMISRMDRVIGRIRARIEELDVADRTLIVHREKAPDKPAVERTFAAAAVLRCESLRCAGHHGA